MDETEALKKALEREGGFLFRFEAFAEIEEFLEKTLGAASEIVLSSMGIPCGRRSCRRLIEKGKGADVLEQLKKLKSAENWGEFTFLDVDRSNRTGKVWVRNSFETRAQRSSNKPICHFLRGYLEGFLSELFNLPITVVEKKCRAAGDEYCEFSFGPE